MWKVDEFEPIKLPIYKRQLRRPKKKRVKSKDKPRKQDKLSKEVEGNGSDAIWVNS